MRDQLQCGDRNVSKAPKTEKAVNLSDETSHANSIHIALISARRLLISSHMKNAWHYLARSLHSMFHFDRGCIIEGWNRRLMAPKKFKYQTPSSPHRDRSFFWMACHSIRRPTQIHHVCAGCLTIIICIALCIWSTKSKRVSSGANRNNNNTIESLHYSRAVGNNVWSKKWISNCWWF